IDREVNDLEETQPFRQQDEKRRAERRAKRRAHATQQRHGEEHHRLRETELVGAYVAKAAGEQSAAEAAQHGRERERNDLGAIGIDTDDAGGEFVVAYRLHPAAKPRAAEAPDEEAHHPKRGDAKREIDAAVLERIAEYHRPLDPADAIGAARDG